MKRLKLFILIFWIALTIPLAYVMWRAYESIAQEERAQLRFFSETLFDQMEKELSDLVQREENRAVDDYRHAADGPYNGLAGKIPVSPISPAPFAAYILGYLQNNPDGSFQTPLAADISAPPQDQRALVGQLREINEIFNRKKFQMAVPLQTPLPRKSELVSTKKAKEQKLQAEANLADRFFTPQEKTPSKTYLGKKQTRMEEITVQQAINLSNDDGAFGDAESNRRRQEPAAIQRLDRTRKKESESAQPPQAEKQAPGIENLSFSDSAQQKFQVEVAPFQSVYIKEDQVFIFRRIAVNNQIYRQGFVLLIQPFFTHLINTYFMDQPLSAFMAIRLQRMDNGEKPYSVKAGAVSASPDFSVARTFPAPFGFLNAVLQADKIPDSPARRSFSIALSILGVVLLLGSLAIYQSARTVVALSERRSRFVSSVTHELKTPLTNIRMYIEMLEQGIAATPEKEQAYLRILGSESARLSGLINNVLELAKLEKKQRAFHLRTGRLTDVLTEVGTVMGQKLTREGFTLTIDAKDVPEFTYDRDVLIQILTNLIENSIKFAHQDQQRRITIRVDARDGWIHIAVSDTGPGIPRHALKKVFDDFYRVDNELTRAAGGTGIGLALVKKFVTAMGGRVQAANNDGPGCVITIDLPLKAPGPAPSRRT